jgi:hypothetical protein
LSLLFIFSCDRLQLYFYNVSLLSEYRLKDRAIRGSIPGRGKRIFHLASVQTGSGAHPASCPGGPFPRAKARPGRDADHSRPSSVEVKNE